MAITAPLLWLDGAVVPARETGAPLTGHALQRGSLVFDVGSVHATPAGPALFRAPEHVARLRRSAALVGLELRFDDEALCRAAARVVADNRVTDGLVRWSVFLVSPEADLVARDPTTQVMVAAARVDPPSGAPLAIAIFDDARKAPPEVLSPETKAAGAYLGPMIARRRAIAAGDDDVVLLDADGDIAEAPVANAFAVIGGELWTPPLGRVLPGITRDSVLTLAREAGIAIREERLPRAAFEAADEAFLTSTSMPIGPIGRINGRRLAAPGPITSRLSVALAEIQRGSDTRGWLRAV